MKESNAEVRIQKALSDAGVASRRTAEQMVADGRVKVDGRPAKIGMKVRVGKQLITVDGERIEMHTKQKKLYLALYKPRGFVTSMHDEKGRRDVSTLTKEIGTRVYPVGRLDLNSEGLLLLTNDGEFANMMMHPRYHVPKIYRVTLGNDITDGQLVMLSEGMELDGKKTAPAMVKVLSKEPGRVVLQMTLTEGRNRQIRRMFERFNIEVKRLKRVQIGPVRLGMLKPGGYRYLTKLELDALMNQVQAGAQSPV